MTAKTALNRLWAGLTILALIAFVFTSGAGAPIVDAAESNDVSSLLDLSVSYYQQERPELSSWWDIVALRSAGVDLRTGLWALPTWTSGDLPKDAPAIQFASYILGFLALNEDPATVWEDRNLPAELAALQDTSGSFGPINAHMWSMIALDAARAEYRVDEALEHLLSEQLADGGLGFSISDPDMSAMALIALSPHRTTSPTVDEAIADVISYLAGQQLANAGFASWGEENCNTLATVISALITAGENPLTGDWVKYGDTMLDALERFTLNDGSFSYLIDPKTSNLMATQQALIALGDLATGQSIWQQLSRPASSVTILLRVEGIEETIWTGSLTTQTTTALDALVEALERGDIPYQLESSDWGDYIQSINGEQSASFGGFDGWLYLVNGEMAAVGADSYHIQDGDELTFYYGMYPPDTLLPQVTITPRHPRLGEDIHVQVWSQYFDWSLGETVEVQVEGARLVVRTQQFVTGPDGGVVVPAATIAKAGSYTLTISQDVAGSYPRLLRGEQALTVVRFHDVAEAHWAFDAIDQLAERGIVQGIGGGYFAPAEDITRAEFTALLVRLFDLQLDSVERVFTDVADNAWYADSIYAAFASGIVQGVAETQFNPEGELTREQMITMLARCLPGEDSGEAQVSFHDSGDIAAWATQHVARLQQAGLVDGFPDGSFQPLNLASRAQSAVLLYRALSWMSLEQ